MKATRGLAVLLFLMVGATLTGCTDDTGAIDQMGHNGYDRMACNDYATMANDVRHDAMTLAQAQAASQQLASMSGRAGDPMVRQAGARLADAFRVRNTRAVMSAMSQFQSACHW